MKTLLKIISLSTLLLSCSDKEPGKVIQFKNCNPIKEAILHAKIDSIYYTLDSTTFDTSYEFNHIGDTLLLYTYDSVGNIETTISYPAFRTRTFYRYDVNGDLQYKRIISDFASEFYFSSFIDTNKRIKYTKEPDRLGSTYLSQTYYNENEFPDSLITYTTNQHTKVKYKECFTYENGKLIRSNKQTLKESINDAKEGGSILADTIIYEYLNTKLSIIKTTTHYPGKQIYKTVDYFDANEEPLYKEFNSSTGFERLKATNIHRIKKR